MPAQKYSEEVKAKMKHEFCQGVTLAKLSRSYNVPLNTIKVWHTAGKWKEEKEKFKVKLGDTLFERLSDKLCSAAEVYIENAILIGELANAGLKKESKNNPVDRDVIKDWTRISKEGASIIKSASPDASEQQMEKMLKELQGLRRGQSSQNKATFSDN